MEEFNDLVDQYHKALYRFGLTLTKNSCRAADLVQQTFVILVQKGHQLKNRSKAKTWLFTTLYHEHLGNVGYSQRHLGTEITKAEDKLRYEEQDYGRKLDARQTVGFLSELDETFCAPLTLFYLQQHSYQEIAEVLDVPIGTVMSRISRGKEQLHKKMISEAAKAPTRLVDF
ncbi:MAG: RNA polymerase sigma factor [Akkermansiaceae bacterium]|jgi:RNA polymerase sigma factor (sigma-70 family)|nr:RNA polymerase sigma factor [Akkermansiaceae bacterium]